ncbi:PDZ domain-containing protein [Streptomyces montanus]|uniref:PDZ domain-containing protein n=1 Tax=Streptomyces montanus TaxID=2580423 RepID=A0A5R9FNM9_9ACTN|nr:PDZ domain-containing protein [Streptomyces montanus]TLS41165.1 PDZ domain-containing protein [Streptomyces montanus]
MEQTALRPKPMPGQEPGGGDRKPAAGRRPHAARRRGRRLMTLLFGLFAGTVLVLSGVGLGAVGATVVGTGKLADLQQRAGVPGGVPRHTAVSPEPSRSKPATGAGISAPAQRRPTLGVEAVDATGPGALLVGVHVPGPGHSAGLVRGDVLLTWAGTRIDSAADLAKVVAAARPGVAVTLTVRHMSGSHQRLSATPGVIT